jgi:hypothetical protein
MTAPPPMASGRRPVPGRGSRSGADTVALTQDASEVFGKLEAVRADGFCTVARWGVVIGPSSGTITRTTRVVGALATANRGYIRSAVAATAAETAIARGEVIDVADAANVVVDFGGIG